jgi:predicted GNAT family N-acyltransferase
MGNNPAVHDKGSNFFKKFNLFGRSPYRLSAATPQETTHDFIGSDGKVYGSVWFRDVEVDGNRIRHIDNFNIYNAHQRGQGIGSIHLRQVIENSERDPQKPTMLTLWAVPAAYTFYKRAGFEDYSVSHTTTTEHIPMKRELKSHPNASPNWIYSKIATAFESLNLFSNTGHRLGPAQHVTQKQALLINDQNYGHILYNDFMHDNVKTRYINNFEITNEKNRRQGHGAQFLNEFITQAEYDNVDVLDAAVKKQAYNLYKRAGFEGEYHETNPLIPMKKKLDPHPARDFLYSMLSA